MPDTNVSGRLDDLADLFAEAWLARSVIDAVPPVIVSTREDGYRVQDLMANRIGETVAGWKAGATSPGMRARDGHDGIVPGRVFASDLHEGSDHVLKAARFPAGRLEPEFAFRFLRAPELRTDWSAERIRGLVVPHIAVELIGSRLAGELPDFCRTTAMTIADNGNGFALVIGPEIPPDVEYDPLTHPVDMRVEGGPSALNSPPDIRASPLDALAETVNLLAGRGISLHPGEYITTGSATTTLPILKDSTLRADFGVLGSIRITFS